MGRKVTIYVVILALIIGLIIFIDASRPKPVDWRPTYGFNDKNPLGLYVLNKEAATLFNGTVKKMSVTPYEFFEEQYDYDKKEYKTRGTFLNITQESALDNESVKELIYFAEHGNTVFLSMNRFPAQLLDTLQVSTDSEFTKADSVKIYVGQPGKSKTAYYFNEGMGFTYFDSIQNPYAKILGYHDVKELHRPNLIKVPMGKGSFLLHTQPAAFSNFHLLKGNHYKYAEEVASYIKNGNIYWFTVREKGISSSPLRYILAQPALKWALYFGLIGILIFMFFNAKRKQRIIPEIPPVRNTTVDFTKTIGNLYYQEGNHHTIIDKKIIYFLEKLRNEYLIDTYSLDDDFIEKLHLKTGKPTDEIRHLVQIIKTHRHKFESTEADVLELNKAIENLML